MIMPLLIGTAITLVSVTIQVFAVVVMLRYLFRAIARKDDANKTMGFEFRVISVAMLVLFIAHLFQVAIWALLFRMLGEFDSFATAYYHSLVNFASLGYGDIVMSEQWRLLGAVEASVGVLMFGLTAGIMITVMQVLFAQRKKVFLPDSE